MANGSVGEQAVNVAPKASFRPNRAAPAAADAARQIDEQRMIGIDHASCLRELRFQALAGYGIAEEQRARVFIIDKKQFGSDSAALRPCSTATP